MSRAIATLILVLATFAAAQTGFGKGKGTKAAVAKGDLESIQCDVCHKAVDEMVYLVEAERALLLKGQKLQEIKVLDILEGICDPKADPAGNWLKSVDIVSVKTASGQYLELVEPGGMAKCKGECATVQESCHRLISEEIDSDDLSSLLYKGKTSAEDLKNKVCKKWTSRCKPRRRNLKEGYKRVDEKFEEMDEKAIEMEKLMAQMESQGLGGNVFGREDMENMDPEQMAGMMGGGGGYGGDDEDGYGGMGGMGGMGGGYHDPYGHPGPIPDL